MIVLTGKKLCWDPDNNCRALLEKILETYKSPFVASNPETKSLHFDFQLTLGSLVAVQM